MRSRAHNQLVLILTLAAAWSASAQIDVNAEPEVAASEAVALYLHYGPRGIVGSLARDSTLRSMEDREGRIELLLGPREGSEWELDTTGDSTLVTYQVRYQSGLDELVTFEMAPEDGGWKIAGIRNSTLGLLTPAMARPAHADSTHPVVIPVRKFFILGIAAALLGGVLMAVGLFRRYDSPMIVSSIVLMVASAAFIIFARSLPTDTSPEAGSTTLSSSDLNALTEFRRSLEMPGEVTVPDHPAAYLWAAQKSLVDGDQEAAGRTLERVKAGVGSARRSLIEARLAAAKDSPDEALAAYTRATHLLPGVETIPLEAAQSALIFGRREVARTWLSEVERRHSRNPNPYFLLAMIGDPGALNDAERSETRLINALRLEPASRRTLLSVPMLNAVLETPEVAEQVRLSSSSEPVWQPRSGAGPKITLPEGWSSRRSGEALVIEQPEFARMILWGLASRAPDGAVTLDPWQWEQIERDRDLMSMIELREASRSPGSWLQPVVSAKLERMIEDLDERNQWDQVEYLTEALPKDIDRISTFVIIARTFALRKLGKDGEALDLASRAARAELEQKTPDARRLFELGDLLGTLDEHELAIKVLRRAQSLRRDLDLAPVIRELELERALARSRSVYRTDHFEIRYRGSENGARKVGRILEDELMRISRRLGAPVLEHCIVNLLDWDQFDSVYAHSSGSMLGFYYDGEITIPLADVRSFSAEVVAILTHELTHAIVANATGDKAPRWFQEGIAQRMEMAHAENAFATYAEDDIMSIGLLDPAFRGSASLDGTLRCYSVSHTLLRFLEEERTYRSWQGLMRAFSAGMTTSQALEKVYGKPLAEIDSEFREWGRTSIAEFSPDMMVRYDESERFHPTMHFRRVYVVYYP